MRFLRALLALALLVTLNGCGYVHFGRLPVATPADDSIGVAYQNLATEKKILQQELALARKEGDALRAALDGRADSAATSELTTRLNETTRELAALRANYAKLQATLNASPSEANRADALAKAGDTEEKLAAALRNFTQLQEENARLRTEVDSTRAENSTLTAQVKTITAQNEQAQAALAQLNTELLAQKAARARAEQQADAARAQLATVVANRDAGRDPANRTLAAARESTADSTTALSVAAAPPLDQPPTAELRTSPERLRAAAGKKAADTSAAAPADAPRIHVVQAGDTLEKLAQKYYGDPSKWNLIYFANNSQLSGGRPLKPGMELEIPEK